MKRERADRPAPAPDQRPGAQAEQAARTAAHGQHLWTTGLVDAPAARAQPQGTGRPLPQALRRRFAGRLGPDLSCVRLHDDQTGRDVAADRGAHALAEGHHIYGAPEALTAQTPDGLARLEHELTHVAQSERAGGPPVSLADERTGGGGFGATAPRVPYEVAEERAPESAHVLFEHDDIHVDEDTLADAIAFVGGHSTPVILELHGYASSEGRAGYNENLSAHRAARVQRELAPYLPAGSEVLLFAHGETVEFGERYGPNRRVGLRVRPMAQSAGAESTAAVPLNPRATPTTDPQPEAAPDAAPEGPSLADPVVLPPSPWTLSPQYRPRIDFGTPDPLRTDLPILRPGCPFAPGVDQMDWFEIMRPLRGRGGQLTDQQTLSLMGSWSATACTYTRMLTPILGPDLAGQAAAAGVNMGLSSAMETSAYWEHPTEADRFDQYLRQQGVETTIIPVSDIILGIYRFAAD